MKLSRCLLLIQNVVGRHSSLVLQAELITCKFMLLYAIPILWREIRQTICLDTRIAFICSSSIFMLFCNERNKESTPSPLCAVRRTARDPLSWDNQLSFHLFFLLSRLSKWISACFLFLLKLVFWQRLNHLAKVIASFQFQLLNANQREILTK